MIGLIGEPEQERRAFKNFAAGLPEAMEFVSVACSALLFVAAIVVVGEVAYQFMCDPNTVDVASRVDMLSIDPNKWISR